MPCGLGLGICGGRDRSLDGLTLAGKFWSGTEKTFQMQVIYRRIVSCGTAPDPHLPTLGLTDLTPGFGLGEGGKE